MRAALALVVLLVFALTTRAATAQLLSPGPLSKGHASLEGDQHCNDCHSSGKRVDQGACLKCHADLGARIAAGQGLHGRQYKGQACEGCHVEHHGTGAALVRWPGGDPSKLDHSQTGWPLKNAHAPLTCNKCHARTNNRGAPTFLGVSSACASCHKDPHENRFGSSCTNCHDDASWKNLKLQSFNHDQARFALKGAHKNVTCAKCHHEPPKYFPLEFQSCASTSCHKDPHAGKLGASCVGCHDENRWKPAQFKTNAHPGVSLANGHAKVACGTCHDKGNLVSPSRGKECVSCHQPVHKAPFGRGCATCHSSINWMGLPRAIGLNAHTRTAYPLTGKHEQSNCNGCHKPELARNARYRQLTFGKCIDCHADQHKGEFAKNQGGECASCHATAGFRPTTFGIAAHGQTRFPLAGKHGVAPCSSCHASARPRLDLHVAKQECVDCHENPHGDQFAKEMKQGGCSHCHTPSGWNLPKIDHSTWPLTGAHASARCERCHQPTPEDKKAGNGASYRGVPRNCAGCHDDLHAGQFKNGQPVIAECDKCHATSGFKIARFDHEHLARWALTGAHEKQACTKCHAMTKLKDDSETIRWRLASSECNFCHADPHAPRAK